MAKIIDIFKNAPKDPEIMKLVHFGNSIDIVIMEWIKNKGCKPEEIAVILGHRLSELLINLGPLTYNTKELIIELLDERVK